MGKYVIDETTLTGIGDAIREKDGTTEGIDPSDMKARIQAIDTQEDLDAEMATQDDLIAQIMTELEGKAAGGAQINLDTCTVNLNPGYYGYVGVVEIVSGVEKPTVHDVVGGYTLNLENVQCGSYLFLGMSGFYRTVAYTNCEIVSSSSGVGAVYKLTNEKGAVVEITTESD